MAGQSNALVEESGGSSAHRSRARPASQSTAYKRQCRTSRVP